MLASSFCSCSSLVFAHRALMQDGSAHLTVIDHSPGVGPAGAARLGGDRVVARLRRTAAVPMNAADGNGVAARDPIDHGIVAGFDDALIVSRRARPWTGVSFRSARCCKALSFHPASVNRSPENPNSPPGLEALRRDRVRSRWQQRVASTLRHRRHARPRFPDRVRARLQGGGVEFAPLALFRLVARFFACDIFIEPLPLRPA